MWLQPTKRPMSLSLYVISFRRIRFPRWSLLKDDFLSSRRCAPRSRYARPLRTSIATTSFIATSRHEMFFWRLTGRILLISASRGLGERSPLRRDRFLAPMVLPRPNSTDLLPLMSAPTFMRPLACWALCSQASNLAMRIGRPFLMKARCRHGCARRLRRGAPLNRALVIRRQRNLPRPLAERAMRPGRPHRKTGKRLALKKTVLRRGMRATQNIQRKEKPCGCWQRPHAPWPYSF